MTHVKFNGFDMNNNDLEAKKNENSSSASTSSESNCGESNGESHNACSNLSFADIVKQKNAAAAAAAAAALLKSQQNESPETPAAHKSEDEKGDTKVSSKVSGGNEKSVAKKGSNGQLPRSAKVNDAATKTNLNSNENKRVAAKAN